MKKYRYLIKSTYLEGPHKGKCYILRKGGYVTDLKQYQDNSDTYASLGFALRACKQLKEQNLANVQDEWMTNAINKKLGRPHKADDQFIYYEEEFVPIRVNPDTDRVDTLELTEGEIEYINSCW